MGKYINSPAVKYVLGVVELLLAACLILRFLGASDQAPFIEVLYLLADVLAAPFKGIFASAMLSWGGMFDMSLFSAIIIYAIFVAIPIFLHKKFKKELPKTDPEE